MIDDAGTPTRRAALLLYAMTPADRDWMLGQLPAHPAQELRQLLRELADLGIPQDRSLLHEVVGEYAAAQALEPAAWIAPEDAGADQVVAAIAAAGAARAGAVLRDEPARLAVMFLSAHAWPWQDEFIRHLGPLRAREVAHLLDTGHAGAGLAMGPEARRALLAAVLRRARLLPGAGVVHPAPLRRPSLPGRAGHWLRRLGGRSDTGAAP